MYRALLALLCLLVLALPIQAQAPPTPNILGGYTSGRAPTASTGNEGNYFLDLSTNAIFGPKTFGNWPIALGQAGDTLGARARRLADIAATSNPVINPPWLLPPSWATSTTYNPGNVVANSASPPLWYVELNFNGSQASCSSLTEPTGLSPVITDTGSPPCHWSPLGGATITASSSNAPTVTAAQTSQPSGLSVPYAPGTFPSLYTPHGCYSSAPTPTLNGWELNAFNSSALTPFNGGCSISFQIDTGNFAIGLSNAELPIRVIVDGRVVTPTGIIAGAATPNYYQVNFTTFSKSWHTVSILFYNYFAAQRFYGVYVGPNDQIRADNTFDAINAVFIGDSILAGSNSGPYLPGFTNAQQTAYLLGWSNPTCMCYGGTGYLVANSAYTYGQRVADSSGGPTGRGNAGTLAQAQFIINEGSENDGNFTTCSSTPAILQGCITAAALATYQSERAINPLAPIIVEGVWPNGYGGANNPAAVLSIPQIESAIQAAYTAFNDSNSYYIPMALATCPIITGPWNEWASQSISSATYVSSTGILALTFATAPFGANASTSANGQPITLSVALTGGSTLGTGPFPVTGTASSGTVVSVQAPTGLGTLTLSSGTLAASACSASTNYLQYISTLDSAHGVEMSTAYRARWEVNAIRNIVLENLR